MAKIKNINKILIIGSGPIIIGQACEFDYSGTQACKALRKAGYKIVLVNSNPATIMTDPSLADSTYIEPLTVESLTAIIKKERPDALLSNLGGQTGLNLSSQLSKRGILEKYGVEIIGVQADAIERGEDRIVFKEMMNKLNIPMPESSPAYNIEEALIIAHDLGYPVIVRPAYTMGGTGGGAVNNDAELAIVVSRGISVSLIGQVLIEQSVIGWEELELEVVRDSKANKITVCFFENIDPMGIHTVDSFCVAPMLTVKQEIQKKLQEYSYKIVDAIGVIGGTNVQFAYNPEDERIVVIEINPRTSRSSALASKATGFPIAYVSSRLAAGDDLKNIPYWKYGTLDKYKPSGEYVVIKFARWAFEKFKNVRDHLGTQMQSVGEAMSIGKTYKEALQKAIRSLEIGRYGLGFVKNFNKLSLKELKKLLEYPTSERQFIMYEALRKGMSIEELHKITKIHRYFINQMKELVEIEEEILKYKNKKLPDNLLIKTKENGFSDKYLSQILSLKEDELRNQRIRLGKVETWEAVPVSGADAAYYFSTYNVKKNLVKVSNKKKIMILGGGPNRIGQGIEFDYCCCHASYTLKAMGYESIMVNCNPETVSTDYDTSDKLYFEPLTVEDILSIYNNEKPLGVIVQFGGQTPLNIAKALEDAGVNILGTSTNSIDLAEDRERFSKVMKKLGVLQTKSGMAKTVEQAFNIAKKIGYPVMVRPSYVLGGRGMECVYDEKMLKDYLNIAVEISPDRPILIDKFLEDALEIETDAICNGNDVFIPSIMEHIEEAGIHSGDSACMLPPRTISKKNIKIIEESTKKIALELKIVGLMNIQYAIAKDKVYILEANPRASRTVPLVSKVTGISMAMIATEIILGKKIKDMDLKQKTFSHVGVKAAVFPFNMFHEADPILGPEMRSTGEVLGIAKSFGLAYYKAEEAAGQKLPLDGTILITVNDKDKGKKLIEVVKRFKGLGFRIVATDGTSKFLSNNGVDTEKINKIRKGRPNIVDAINNKEINLIINTPIGKSATSDDSYIRKSAIKYKIPYITTISAALAASEGIKAFLESKESIKSLQEYHREIR